MNETEGVPLRLYSAALDEIYKLRTLLAYEAAVREADLKLKTYPKSRREMGVGAIGRMRNAACGLVSLKVITPWALHNARDLAGMPQMMTRDAWENEHAEDGAS